MWKLKPVEVLAGIISVVSQLRRKKEIPWPVSPLYTFINCFCVWKIRSSLLLLALSGTEP